MTILLQRLPTPTFPPKRSAAVQGGATIEPAGLFILVRSRRGQPPPGA
jgi:hypothetical protein